LSGWDNNGKGGTAEPAYDGMVIEAGDQ